MTYDQGNPQELKDKFWKELASSPYVMLQLDNDPDSAAPMTAQLDKDANGAIWFFTSHDNRFAGTLTEETSAERKDELWNNFVEAWFPEGKASALLLRMDLGDASIWSGEMGVLNVAKMAMGLNVRDDIKGGYAQVAL